MVKEESENVETVAGNLAREDETVPCRWCSERLSLDDYWTRGVCRRCYSKLVAAGLSDDQIVG